MVITVEKIRNWLKEVSDPEIPVLSLFDMGIITYIEVSSEGKVRLDMTPTFAGCPAIEYMKNDVIRVLEENGVENPEVYTISGMNQKPNNESKRALRMAISNYI